MTITTTDSVQTHRANGESFFPIAFPYASAADIRATVTTPDGLSSELHFIVTPAGDLPVGVLFSAPPPLGSQVRIWRETSPLQQQAWKEGVEYPARVHEAAHDRRAMVDIDLRRDLQKGLSSLRADHAAALAALRAEMLDLFSRTLRTPEGVPELPAARERVCRALTFDAAGRPRLVDFYAVNPFLPIGPAPRWTPDALIGPAPLWTPEAASPAPRHIMIGGLCS